MTFWCGSGSGPGSADPCLWLMDPDPDADPDPAIFVTLDLQDANKKLIYFFYFFCWLLFEGTITSFLKIKSQKEDTNNRNQGFSYYFCLVIEGSGSGSRRPKNMWIRWIRIRIRNTVIVKKHHQIAVLWIRIRLDQHWFRSASYGTGSARGQRIRIRVGKMTHKKEKNIINILLKCWMFSFEAWRLLL